MGWFCALVSIPVLSIFGRKLQFWVADTVGYTVAAWVIGIALFMCVSLLLVYVSSKRMPVHSFHLVWFVGVFLILPFFLDRVEERLHFLTFGFYGALSMFLFKPKLAILLCLLLSGGDELLQLYLSDRVGDWRDVAMNALASLSAGLFTWLHFVRSNDVMGDNKSK